MKKENWNKLSKNEQYVILEKKELSLHSLGSIIITFKKANMFVNNVIMNYLAQRINSTQVVDGLHLMTRLKNRLKK